MTLKWDTIITSTVALCCVITTGLVVHRQFFAPTPTQAQPASSKPIFVEDWKSHLRKGVQLGPVGAQVQIIEFADFECPFCASFHTTLKALRDRYPTQVSLSFVHYPLSGHRFAESAARVSECAAEQGRFEAMQDRLFEQQKEFGLKPWREFAVEANVADLAAFDRCIDSKEPVTRVVEGTQLAGRLDVQGTPTLIVNGWKLARPPSAEELDGMVNAVLAGKNPISLD